MRTTEFQKRLIESLQSIMGTWAESNDIDSPTHNCEIETMLNADFDEERVIYRVFIVDKMEQLLDYIRRNGNEREQQ